MTLFIIVINFCLILLMDVILFYSADEIPILRVKGDDLTPKFLEENGFDVPVLVEKKDGLDIVVPPPDFSIQDIENMVGKYIFFALINSEFNCSDFKS